MRKGKTGERITIEHKKVFKKMFVRRESETVLKEKENEMGEGQRTNPLEESERN